MSNDLGPFAKAVSGLVRDTPLDFGGSYGYVYAGSNSVRQHAK